MGVLFIRFRCLGNCVGNLGRWFDNSVDISMIRIGISCTVWIHLKNKNRNRSIGLRNSVTLRIVDTDVDIVEHQHQPSVFIPSLLYACSPLQERLFECGRVGRR